MRIMKKAAAATIAAAMCVSLMAGCGSSASSSSAAASSEAAPAASSSEAAASESKLDYPTKNVNVIVPFGAGGNTDMSTRALLNVASEAEGITFVVDNLTGNSGLIGMESLAESDPDGYTIGAIAVDLELHIAFGRTELQMSDFVPLAATMADPYGLVISTSNANYSTIEEFVEYAKANPGKVKIGTSGNGGAPHLAALAFAKAFGLEFDFYTYDGSADCVTAIASGEIDGTFTQPTPAKAQMEAGDMAMIVVLADERMASYPDCPTAKEIDPNCDLVMAGWVVVAAPAGTPTEITDYLTDAFAAALQTDEYKQNIEALGMQHTVLYGADLQKLIDDNMAMFTELCADIEL